MQLNNEDNNCMAGMKMKSICGSGWLALAVMWRNVGYHISADSTFSASGGWRSIQWWRANKYLPYRQNEVISLIRRENIIAQEKRLWKKANKIWKISEDDKASKSWYRRAAAA